MVEVLEDKQHGVCGKKKWNWVGVLSLSFHFLLPTIISSMFHIHIHPSTISVTYSKYRSRSINCTKHTPHHTFVLGKFSPQFSLSVLRLVPMGIQKSFHFKGKIKAIFQKSLKRLQVYWCNHITEALMTTTITLQKDVTHQLRTTICMLQHPWFIYGRASVVKDEICLQYGCKQAWMYETRKRHEKILHKKYLERSDVHLATSGGGRRTTPPF